MISTVCDLRPKEFRFQGASCSSLPDGARPMTVSAGVSQKPDSGEVLITSVHAAPLFGDSPKGGWSAEIRPEDTIHAIIAVKTSAGITGYGSVFTDGRLVQAGLSVLEPLFTDETALEPERVSEKLHQNTFWMGRGGTLTHVISGIDIGALGHPRQGHRAAGRALARRRLSPARAAVLLAADGGAGAHARHCAGISCTRISRLQDRLGSVRTRGRHAGSTKRSCGAARDAAGDACQAVRRCRGERRPLAARAQMGHADRGNAEGLSMLAGSRSRCGPTRSTISAICAGSARCRSPAARC